MVVLKLYKQLRMCTLSDLPSNALILDVQPGEYELRTHEGGYIFLKKGVNIQNKKIVKVFNNRDGEYGFSGTYHDGDSTDVEQLRLFNDHFWRYVDWKYEDYEHYYEPEYDESDDGFDIYEDHNLGEYYETDEDYFCGRERYRQGFVHVEEEEGFDERIIRNRWRYGSNGSLASSASSTQEPPRKRLLIQLPSYHNLPILFYMSKPVQNMRNVDLMLLPTQIKDDIAVWEIKENAEHLGYAVKSPLHNMMGDQAGIAVYQGVRAFGNFEPKERLALNDKVFDSWNEYKCEINPCNCRIKRY